MVVINMKLNKHKGDFSEVQQTKIKRNKEHQERLKKYHDAVAVRAGDLKAIEKAMRTSR